MKKEKTGVKKEANSASEVEDSGGEDSRDQNPYNCRKNSTNITFVFTLDAQALWCDNLEGLAPWWEGDEAALHRLQTTLQALRRDASFTWSGMKATSISNVI